MLTSLILIVNKNSYNLLSAIKQLQEMSKHIEVEIIFATTQDVSEKNILLIKESKLKYKLISFNDTNKSILYNFKFWDFIKLISSGSHIIVVHSDVLLLNFDISLLHSYAPCIFSPSQTSNDIDGILVNSIDLLSIDRDMPLKNIQFKRVNVPMFNKMPPYPSLLFLEITKKYNLDCEYCRRKEMTIEEKQQEMPYEKIVETLDKFNGVSELNIIGNGEPFLHSDWDKIVKLIDDRNLNLMFTTNGTMLTKENVSALPQGTNMFISLDINHCKTIEMWNKIESNIKMVREVRPNMHVVIQPVVTKEFKKYINRYVELCLKYNMKLSPILPITYTKELYDSLYPSIMEKNEISSMLSKYPFVIKSIEAFPKLRFCQYPFTTAFVTVDGDVFPCCYLYSARNSKQTNNFREYFDDKDVCIYQTPYMLGNIFKDSLDSILTNDKLLKTRKIVITTSEDDFKTREHNKTYVTNDYCKVCMNRWGMAC
jgi:MoaA/NifB/PqqE/SkfB family radical SAM enzyme